MLDRRNWLAASGCGLLTLGGSSTRCSPWAPFLSQHLAASEQRKRHVILLWMTGGASQTDTFDMKPGHANGGEFREIATAVPGLRWCEHLPKLAEHANRIAVVRSVNTKEGDHGRGTHLMRTGYPPMGPIRYPSIGASLAKELSVGSSGTTDLDPADTQPDAARQSPASATPGYVAISPYRAFNQSAFGPGFLGPPYAPLTVGATDLPTPATSTSSQYADLKVDDLEPPTEISREQFATRVGLWRTMEDRFVAKHGGAARAHNTVYRRALKLMESPVREAFELSQETDDTRTAYGSGRFGQGCLLARRLIERGVGFVEVSLGSLNDGAFGWDTHQNNFTAVKRLCGELDAGWSSLMRELSERGLLESTTILWLSEFGRTPTINAQAGRDHFPSAWSCVFAGGGIRGGQAFGKTSDDGLRVEENQVHVGDILATLCTAAGVDPETQNISEAGRPIRLAEGKPIREILT